MAKNRNANRQRRVDKRDKRRERSRRGEEQLAAERSRKAHDNDWQLDWFSPKGQQMDVARDFYSGGTFNIIDAPSGCGKTSVALWLALQEYKRGNYRKLLFIKTPAEVGCDPIGFLSGSETDKLKTHLETTKFIFHEFMSPNKLDNDIGRGNITLTVPNFVLGATWNHTLVVLDETQLFNPDTMKLLLERCGEGTKYFVLGDSSQRYAVKKRSDGFKDLIEKVTKVVDGQRVSKYPMVNYNKMSTDENKRSEGSKFVTKLYEGELS